ncbi:MAG TPA: hypothetical protein VEB66_01845 [Opitutaceae bacterium]|nr:hypothetical protein [Opitutaceae bacterium]
MPSAPPRARPFVPLLAASLLALAGCGTFITPAEDDGGSVASTVGGQFMEVRVNSSPTMAMITLNGRPIGIAPLTARMEVDRNGELVDDVVLGAEFTGGSGAEGGGRVVEQHFARGTQPPSAVSFNPEGGSYLGR